jgi:hypothetical protein
VAEAPRVVRVVGGLALEVGAGQVVEQDLLGRWNRSRHRAVERPLGGQVDFVNLIWPHP